VKQFLVIIGLVALGLGLLFLLGIWNLAEAPVKDTEQLETVPSRNKSRDETGDKIAKDIKIALAEKHQWNPDEFEITVTQQDGRYARGGVSVVGTPAGGGMVYAAQVNESWEIVWDGNGAVTCSDLNDYPEYPVEMIPECYDPNSGLLIKR
jgi:hypothetical protein